jgi:hypothetical protein
MYFIKYLAHDRIINLQFCPSSEHTADLFTNTFTGNKFQTLWDHLVVNNTIS